MITLIVILHMSGVSLQRTLVTSSLDECVALGWFIVGNPPPEGVEFRCQETDGG